MKGIIERLVVSPESSCYSKFMVEKYNSQGEPDLDYVAWLEDGWKELLEALIDNTMLIESAWEMLPSGELDELQYYENIEVIEKACYPKKWPEIKAILEENDGNKL